MEPYDDTILIPSALKRRGGAWLAVSPFVVGYSFEDPLTDRLVCGAAVA